MKLCHFGMRDLKGNETMNEPAFPVPMFLHQDRPENVYDQGMTLRDYFAAAASTSLIAESPNDDTWASRVAHGAYELADAMLAERAKIET
jgi:hypothetical protein